MRMFIFPLIGILLLAWGAWTSFLARRQDALPPLEVQVAAGILGALWGWVMANLAYAPDAAHRIVGFPLPVYRWVNLAGTWTDQSALAAVPCLLLDILIGTLLATRLARTLWTRFQPLRARNRRRR